MKSYFSPLLKGTTSLPTDLFTDIHTSIHHRRFFHIFPSTRNDYIILKKYYCIAYHASLNEACLKADIPRIMKKDFRGKFGIQLVVLGGCQQAIATREKTTGVLYQNKMFMVVLFLMFSYLKSYFFR